jgi:serine/threonine protein kinase
MMQDVAIKTVKEKLDGNALKEFVAEIKLIKSLNSPSVVRVFGVATLSGDLCLVMEYCSKGSLLSWLKSERGSSNIENKKVTEEATEILFFSYSRLNLLFP